LYKLQVTIRGTTTNKTDKLLSNSSVYKHILKRWSIHHSIDATVCPHCKFLEDHEDKPIPAQLLEKGKKKDLEKFKKKLVKERSHRVFRATKDKLAAGQLPNTLVLLQDFTQLHPQSGFQDLILTLMKHDKDAGDHIQKKYLH